MLQNSFFCWLKQKKNKSESLDKSIGCKVSRLLMTSQKQENLSVG